MGAKEDLVRERLEKVRLRQEQERLEGERRNAERMEQEAIEQAKHMRLFDEIDIEATRIAELLEAADWSKAELKTFIHRKEHWWQRDRNVDYACLDLRTARFPLGWEENVWMRSDGILFIEGRRRLLTRPSIVYPRSSDTEAVTELLERLRTITSLSDFKWLS